MIISMMFAKSILRIIPCSCALLNSSKTPVDSIFSKIDRGSNSNLSPLASSEIIKRSQYDLNYWFIWQKLNYIVIKFEFKLPILTGAYCVFTLIAPPLALPIVVPPPYWCLIVAVPLTLAIVAEVYWAFKSKAWWPF